MFGKLNIEQKLLFSFAFFIVLTVGLGIYSIVKFGEEDSVAKDLAGNAVAGIRVVAQMDDLVTSFRRGELLLAISQDPAGKEKYIKRMEDDAEKLKLCFDKYEKLIDSDVERRTFGEFSSNWEKFLVEHTKVIEVARQGNLAQVDAVIRGDSSKYFNLAIKALKENEDGQLGLAQKECEDLLSGSRRTKFSIVAVLLGCTVFGLGFGMRVARRISTPLRHLVEKAARVAQGDMTVHIENETADEVGRLADAFNGMLGSLKEIIGKVIDLSGQVAAAAEQLQSEALVMAKDSDHVVAQTNTIAAASEEMSATSGTIAANCELAAENSGHANDAASSGAVIINATVEGMNRIAEFVRQSSATVEGLGEQSNQIGAIVGTIEDIADQTNLLALNAAIEAARAGDQGRGFAVVADEVRALAERTTKATREIGDMIKSIQQETAKAVAAMEEGVKEVGRGTDDAARSGQALQDIVGKIEGLALQVNQIATAAEQQTATTGQISQNLIEVHEAANDASRGAQETASAASKLAGTADELKSLARHFRL